MSSFPNAAKILVGILSLGWAQFACADNVSLGGVATASSVYSPLNRLPSFAIDNDPVTFWSATTRGSVSVPQWIQVDLGASFKLSEIGLYGHDTDYYDSTFSNIYNLYVSNSVNEIGDIVWGEVIQSGELFDSPDYFDVIPMFGQEIRYIKYEVVGGKHWAYLNELRAVVDQQTITTDLIVTPHDQSCLRSKKRPVGIEVAIIGTTELDVATLDLQSLSFDGLQLAGEGLEDGTCRIVDMNSDFLDDLVCTFAAGDITAQLSGATVNGTAVLAAGTVCIK
jgi:hypothetical protein